MKNRINCALIASYGGSYGGNFIASLYAFDNAMRQRGHKVIYIFPTYVEKFEWGDRFREVVESVYYIEYKPHSINNFLEIKKILKQEKINLIYSRLCGWDFTAHFAAPTVPIIWHMEMRVLITDITHYLKNWLKFNVLAFGKTYHIAVSYPVQEAINSLKPRNKCVAIPNAIDFKRLEEGFSSKMEEPYKLLIFGWSPIVKGLDIVLDALQVINKDKCIIKLLISSSNMAEQYIDERFSDSKPEWVFLLPPTDNITELYSQADFLVSASRSEGFPYSVAEAIYLGLPVIHSDIPGTIWVNDFGMTYSFKSQDSNDLVRAIRDCIRSGINLDIQKSNRALMRERYSMDSWVDSVVSYVEKIAIQNII